MRDTLFRITLFNIFIATLIALLFLIACQVEAKVFELNDERRIGPIALSKNQLYVAYNGFVDVYDFSLNRITAEENVIKTLINKDFPDGIYIGGIGVSNNNLYLFTDKGTCIYSLSERKLLKLNKNYQGHIKEISDSGFYDNHLFRIDSKINLKSGDIVGRYQRSRPGRDGIMGVAATDKRIYHLQHNHSNNGYTIIRSYRHDGFWCEEEDLNVSLTRYPQYDSISVSQDGRYFFLLSYGKRYKHKNTQEWVHEINLHRYDVKNPLEKYDNLVYVSEQPRPIKPVDTTYPSRVITGAGYGSGSKGGFAGRGGVAVTCNGVYVSIGGTLGYNVRRYNLDGIMKYTHYANLSGGVPVGMSSDKNYIYFVVTPKHDDSYTIAAIDREYTNEIMQQWRQVVFTNTIKVENNIKIEGMFKKDTSGYYFVASVDDGNSPGVLFSGGFHKWKLHEDNRSPKGLVAVSDRFYILDVNDQRSKIFAYTRILNTNYFIQKPLGEYLPEESFELGLGGGEGIAYTDGHFYVFHQYHGVLIYGKEALPVWKDSWKINNIKIYSNSSFELHAKDHMLSGSPAPTFELKESPEWISMKDGLVSGKHDKVGTYAFTLTAKNSEGAADKGFNFIIEKPPIPTTQPEPEPEPETVDIFAAPTSLTIPTKLFNNFPNPFNPETWIPYQLSQASYITISIYDMNFKLISNIDLGYNKAGIYKNKDTAAYWDGRNNQGEQVASGVYLCIFNAGTYTDTIRLVISR